MTLAWLQLSYRQTEAYSFSTETAVAFITAKIVASLRDTACCHRNRRFQLQKAVNLSSACTTKRFPSPRCASATKIVRPLDQSLKCPAILGVGVTRLSSAMNPKTASNPHHPRLLFANSNQFQTLLLNGVWLFPFLQVGNSNTQDYMELLPIVGTSPLRQGEFPSLRQWKMLAGSRMPARLSIGHYRAGTP